jgi:hypothetical protein
MSYSRRQLYAMGETFGDSATRMEAGGRIVYGGGGGGGDQPKTVEPTTRVTEYGPDMASFNRSSTNEIPRYLTDASQDLVARGQALSSRPYEAYTGARVAEFSPLMNQAFDRMGGQQVAGQLGQATGLAGLAGQRAMQAGSSLGPYDPYQTQAPAQYAAGQYNPYTEQATAQYAAGQYNPYEMGGFDAQRAQQYMNPYMQNVVDVERRKAQEASDRQSAQLSSQAAKQGAFGGSGAALQQRALTRDTAQQLGDIQTQGMGRAYDQGLARFGAEEAMREQSRQYGSGFGESSRQFGAQFGEAALRAEREMAERSRQFGANFGESSRQFGAQFGESSLQAERARQEASRQFGANYGLQGEQLGLEGLRTGLSASGQLGQLGQQQFGQEMDITKGIATAGDVQRQREQALLDVGYGDYLTEQKYPYEQLAFQQGLVAGVPYSTTQRSAGQEISQRGKTVEQTMKTTEKAPNNQVDAITPMPTPMNRSNMAAGGVVGHYDEGGITSLLSDQQIDQRQQMPNISDLARMALQAEEMERARMRAAQQGIMSQRPQGTVADEERARIAALEGGIGGLDVPDDLVGDEYTAAGGGIVAFQNRGEVPDPNAYGLPAISNSLIPKPAQDLMAQQRRLAQDVSGQEVLAAQENIAALRRDQAALGDYTKNQEGRLQTREQSLEGADAGALQNSVLDFGLRLLSAKGKANQAAALAEAGLGTLKSHREALDKINKEKKDIDDARSRLDELRYSNKKTDLGAIRDAEKDYKNAKINGTKALGTLIGADAKTVIDAYAAQKTRSAQYAAANKLTNEREFVKDYVEAARTKGDPRPDAVLRTEAVEKYPAMLTQAARAGTAADVAETTAARAQADRVDKAKKHVADKIGAGGPNYSQYQKLLKADRDNKTETAKAFEQKLYDDYMALPPVAAPAPAPASVSASAPPSIASIDGAPRGATIGAQTSRGWEVKDRSGKVIGYAQ